MASWLRLPVSTAGLAPVVRRYITTSSRSLAHAAENQNQSILQSPYTPSFTAPEITMSPSTPFLEALKSRRTYYALTNQSPIPDAKIQEIINEVVLHVPSSFNSQSTRVILLLKGEHEKLWDITRDVLKEIVPEEQYARTEAKMGGFKAAYGTVLFFTDSAVTKEFQAKFSLYADRFPTWATESDGMHQLAVWTALELEGFGANLQHYNPLIDERVRKEWSVPESWVLTSSVVFGTKVGEPGAKTYVPVEERVKVFGA